MICGNPWFEGANPWLEGGLIDPLPAPNAGRTASAVMAQMPEKAFVIEDLVIIEDRNWERQPAKLAAGRSPMKTAVLPYLFQWRIKIVVPGGRSSPLAGYSVALFF